MSKREGKPAAPTGCFKCGRPGHWSRDCPSSPASNSNPNLSTYSKSNLANSFKPPSEVKALTAAAKKVPRSRPKLTPDILLSDDGLGYVLRHFPRAFKYHGPGHEVKDLGNLIGMYAEWHSHLIPYYSFDQFVRKVEQVGASRRVRRCIDQLKDRVARGGDPSKLNEEHVELVDPDKVPDNPDNEGMGAEESVAVAEDLPMEDHGQEVISEVYQRATDDLILPRDEPAEKSRAVAAPVEPPYSATDSPPLGMSRIQITEEQRARMEANRLKALERAKQARSSQPL